jgi:hypothetical protein
VLDAHEDPYDRLLLDEETPAETMENLIDPTGSTKSADLAWQQIQASLNSQASEVGFAFEARRRDGARGLTSSFLCSRLVRQRPGLPRSRRLTT